MRWFVMISGKLLVAKWSMKKDTFIRFFGRDINFNHIEIDTWVPDQYATVKNTWLFSFGREIRIATAMKNICKAILLCRKRRWGFYSYQTRFIKAYRVSQQYQQLLATDYCIYKSYMPISRQRKKNLVGKHNSSRKLMLVTQVLGGLLMQKQQNKSKDVELVPVALFSRNFTSTEICLLCLQIICYYQ